jgi:PAS domain S-box-containing protein
MVPLVPAADSSDDSERRHVRDDMAAVARLLDAVDVAVITTDRNGTVSAWNRAAEVMYGWSAAEAQGRSVVELTVGSDAVEASARLVAVLAETGIWEREFTAGNKNGTIFPAYVRGIVHRDEHGRPAGIIGVSVDISKRDERERELRAAAHMSEMQRARAEELEASRARIAEAADAAVRQIERDLHDGAQQRLGAVLVRLELVRTLLDSDPPEAARLLQRTQTELAEGLRELRELARGIRPAILRESGLDAAIRALAIRAPIDVEVTLDNVGALRHSAESTLYFVTAEALTNVARHSGASSAEVVLRREPRAVTVTIRDDGNGELDERRGSGISGLRDRVEALGGTFSATSTPGRGTVIAARLPVEPVPRPE